MKCNSYLVTLISFQEKTCKFFFAITSSENMQSRARLLLEKEQFKMKKDPVWVSKQYRILE